MFSKIKPQLIFLISLLLVLCSFLVVTTEKTSSSKRISVIFDTDTNNELDDQHALAYLLFSENFFDIKGVTVNATKSGGDIDKQYEEAWRVLKLCAKDKKIPLLKGSNGDFNEIKDKTGAATFDGHAAVDFIIKEARKAVKEPLTLIAVGKLTNVALAIKKDPAIIDRIRLVWLGSNYPESGEYNLENDTAALNYVLNSNLPFELVTVRYGKPSGTDAVRVTRQTIESVMPGLGPKVAPVMGRHQRTFTSFGDYSVNLFEHIDYHGDPPSRALFDMAAVAIVKNSNWAFKKVVPAPLYKEGRWVEQPGNKRKITVWENFDKEGILTDFFTVMKTAQ